MLMLYAEFGPYYKVFNAKKNSFNLHHRVNLRIIPHILLSLLYLKIIACAVTEYHDTLKCYAYTNSKLHIDFITRE